MKCSDIRKVIRHMDRQELYRELGWPLREQLYWQLGFQMHIGFHRAYR